MSPLTEPTLKPSEAMRRGLASPKFKGQTKSRLCDAKQPGLFCALGVMYLGYGFRTAEIIDMDGAGARVDAPNLFLSDTQLERAQDMDERSKQAIPEAYRDVYIDYDDDTGYGSDTVWGLVPTLNDDAGWTIVQIADWLEDRGL